MCVSVSAVAASRELGDGTRHATVPFTRRLGFTFMPRSPERRGRGPFNVVNCTMRILNKRRFSVSIFESSNGSASLAVCCGRGLQPIVV